MKRVKTYRELLEGKLYMEEEISFDQDINWNDSIDISTIWKKYNEGKLDLSKFNYELSQKLSENHKNDFSDIINKLKNESDKSKSIYIWNNLYDKADEKLIEIKA
ncbi:MAG: hypothetical protein ACOCP8_07045 [archaeon]